MISALKMNFRLDIQSEILLVTTIISPLHAFKGKRKIVLVFIHASDVPSGSFRCPLTGVYINRQCNKATVLYPMFAGVVVRHLVS